MAFLYVFLILLSFFLGAIPFGLIIGRIKAGVDITRRGSGNIGAANVAREIGIGWGIITLMLDISKGFFPLIIAMNIPIQYHNLFLIVLSLAVLIGHMYSPFLKFRGGKGVSTGFGIFLALSPVSAIISCCIFLLTVYIFNYISLGSIAGACFMPIILTLMDKSATVIVISLLTASLILVAHSKNIIRIITGHERRWKNRS
jgi:acyl phosphate:glycerol-3-phosphate acyltransferase